MNFFVAGWSCILNWNTKHFVQYLVILSLILHVKGTLMEVHREDRKSLFTFQTEITPIILVVDGQPAVTFFAPIPDWVAVANDLNN